MRKANYARIEASYGSRHPIADREQIKLDSAIEAILAKMMNANLTLHYHMTRPHRSRRRKFILILILMLLIVPLTLC